MVENCVKHFQAAALQVTPQTTSQMLHTSMYRAYPKPNWMSLLGSGQKFGRSSRARAAARNPREFIGPHSICGLPPICSAPV
jgi:hypothetical protein